MIETPHIAETKEQLLALIPVTVSREDIRSAMDAGVAEIVAALSTQGIAPTGPWLTHHLRRPNETFDFEICFPVAQAIAPSGKVVPGTWPAMSVARTIYHGDYSGLPAAWADFHTWLDANGHQTAQDLWEVYVVNPETSREPSTWRTELNRPLID